MEKDLDRADNTIHPIQSDKHFEEDFRKEVEDATALLDFVVAQGFKDPDGRKLDDKIIEEIKKGQDLLDKPERIPATDRAVFDKAYRDLALFVSPVTIGTLRATSDEFGRFSRLSPMRTKTAEAIIWSRKLTLWTVYFVSIAVVGDLLNEISGQFLPPLDEVRDVGVPWRYYLQALMGILVPFTYGGIGSCAYLLRSCHQYIYTRQFDPRRIPEYYNRMLLGVVSGGAITLFVSQIQDGKGATVRLSAAALGFLAGYNTDFLFNTVERVTAAILPKVGVETVQTAMARRSTALSVSLEGVSLKDLLDRHSKTTTPEERKFIEGLIEKVKERL